MIELIKERICFRFPDIHPIAECHILFQRSLRLPEESGRALGPGRGGYLPDPIDEYISLLPTSWRRHGGMLLPMYQSEALWLRFFGDYPCAIKVAVGSTNGLTGKMWQPPLVRRPQDYLVMPDQPWMLGYYVEPGRLHQFIPAPLAAEPKTATSLLENSAVTLELVVFPMKTEAYRELQEIESHHFFADADTCNCLGSACSIDTEMDRTPEGLMQLNILHDDYGWENWDQSRAVGCFVYLVNTQQYHAVTGREPPHLPLIERDYLEAGITWNTSYAEIPLLAASPSHIVSATDTPRPKGTLDNEAEHVPSPPQALRRFGRVRQVREADS